MIDSKLYWFLSWNWLILEDGYRFTKFNK
jgi:hypothetical protein